MKTPETPREARKKLLLLEAQLHRIDLMQARQDWHAATRNGLFRSALSAPFGGGWKSGAGRLLLTLLPVLLRGGGLARWARRGMLLAGGGAAALALLNRWLRPDGHPPSAENADEKNPGRDRD